MAKKRVLMTGAAGYISSLLIPAFMDRFELVLLDAKREGQGRGGAGPEVKGNDAIEALRDRIIEVDLTDPDVEKYRRHFEGVDAIVHNGWVNKPETRSNAPVQWLDDRPPNAVDSYYQERDNLDMAFHVFKLALEQDVRRVVVTSSNHAADWYETKLHRGRLNTIGPDTYPRSDNFYGWAKACYEHLGFVFATGRFGRAVSNVQIRIGAPRPIEWAKYDGNETWYRRDLGAYISASDMQQLYIKSIETEAIEDTDGIPFQVFYGISNNTRTFWNITNAREIIDYAPEDDSERLFADDIRRHLGSSGRTA